MATATRTESKFAPITLVIETEEEATTLYHRLNVADTVLTDYRRQYNLPIDSTCEGITDLFNALDAVFDPFIKKGTK